MGDPSAERLIRQALGNGGQPEQPMVPVSDTTGATQLMPWQVALVTMLGSINGELHRIANALADQGKQQESAPRPHGLSTRLGELHGGDQTP